MFQVVWGAGPLINIERLPIFWSLPAGERQAQKQMICIRLSECNDDRMCPGHSKSKTRSI